jgi:hypothetical protein
MTTSRRTGKSTQGHAAEPDASSDPQALEQEIARTREQLGETAGQLVAKSDVKGRVRAKMAGLSGLAKTKVGQTQQKVAASANRVRGRLGDAAAATRQQATATAAPAWQVTPEPLRQAVARSAGAARRRPVPLAAAAAGSLLIVGYLAIKRWRATH